MTSAHSGLIEIQGGNFAGSISGKLEVDIQGEVTLSGALTFKGPVFLEASSTLTLSGALSRTVAFDPNATLMLTKPATFTGTLSNFAQTDAIDLTTVKFNGASFTFDAVTDILHVTDGAHSADLHFADGYTAADFELSNDGHKHTFVITSSAGHSGLHPHHDFSAMAVPDPETTLAQYGIG